MKERFATWSSGKEKKRQLLALQLDKAAFKVDIYVFDEADIDKEFAEKLEKEWTKGKELAFPEKHTLIARPLSEDSLLPDDIKVDETGKIRNLQNEWAYLLLTEKLVESIVDELNDIKEKVNTFTSYSKDAFEQTKTLWERILDHRREKNISQEKVDELKEAVNAVFDKLKELRSDENKKYGEQAETIYNELKTQIDQIIDSVKNNGPAKELFEQLKEQRNNVIKLTLRKPSREELHKLLDEAFDLLKNRRNDREVKHNEKRIHDLTEIINKLQKSQDYDKKDLDFQIKRRNDKNVNQLESKLREAKITMLEEKIASKEEKLADVRNTLASLQKPN